MVIEAIQVVGEKLKVKNIQQQLPEMVQGEVQKVTKQDTPQLCVKVALV